MSNNDDREEIIDTARRIREFSYVTEKTKDGKSKYPWFKLSDDGAANLIQLRDSRIRAEAVKAERERIRSSLMGKIESMKMISTSIPGPEYEFRMTRWAMDEVLTFISTEGPTEDDTH